MFRLYLLILLIALGSCSLSTPSDFRCEGEALCRALVKELKKIHNKEELVKAVPKLRKRYLKIAEIAVLAKEFQKKHPDYYAWEAEDESEASLELNEEMERIYRIAGAREVMEKAQSEALRLLDSNAKH